MAEEVQPTTIDRPRRRQPDAVTVIWSPGANPAQRALLECPVFEVFFGGARGGGKTDGVLGEFAKHAGKYGERASGLMVRRTRAELVDTIERSRSIYGPLGWKLHEQDKMWRAPDGARLRFAYLERDADADLYQGHSYTRVYVEEIGNFPSPAPILKLMATLRSGAGVPVGFRATGNPGGPGHQWVKARYIDPAPLGNRIIRDALTGLERVFIPSRVDNNSHIDVAAYKQRLRASGSAELVRAWLDGDWSVAMGAFFDCWENKRHVIEPFVVPSEWMRFRSGDWGSASPFSFGWWAVVPDLWRANSDLGLLPRGCLVRYREWYGMQPGQPNVGLKLHAEEVGRILAEKEKGEKIAYGVLDPSAFKEDGGPSIAERIMAGSKNSLSFRPADNSRVAQRGAMGGWDQLRSRLVGDAEGRPMIVTFSTCVDSIRTIPFLQHDPDRPEDVMTDSEDHCFAAGTLVATDRGLVPIERLVGTRGRVLSLNGYEPYRSARMTRRNTPVVRLSFGNGRCILCTKDHKFLVDFDEWRYASDLTGRSVLCAQSSLVTQFKSLLMSAITCVADTSSAKAGGCMSRCGNIIADLFRVATMFTTRITTVPIIRLATSNASLDLSIWAAGMGRRADGGAGERFPRLSLQPPHGMEAPRDDTGTRGILRSIFSRPWIGAFLQCARNAVRNIWSVPRGLRKVGSAARTVGRVRCVSVEEAGSADVYCLTVPTTGCFAIDGGMLVSNCGDEWRYACMSRPWVPTIETEKPKNVSGYAAVRETVRPGDWRAY